MCILFFGIIVKHGLKRMEIQAQRRINYWFTCTTVAGGKPLKYVEDAWL
jgi:hypothetical protein